jgi:Cdc6-like AAA superfamily ATPase
MVIYREKDEGDSRIPEEELGEGTLNHDYLPSLLQFRENEISSIAKNFKSLFSKSNLSTIITVLGGPGYGKTATVRFTVQRILDIAEKRNITLYGNYHNCWTNRSASAIVSEVISTIIGSQMKTKGISAEELITVLRSHLNEENAHLILILDDINALTADDLNTFFILQENNRFESRISLILISRPTEWNILASNLNSRINEIITFYPYTAYETLEIIKYRGNLAFKEESVDFGVYDIVADISFDSHNMRLGLELLARAAEFAVKNSRNISTEIIREVKSRIFPELRVEVLESLHQHELLTLIGIAKRLTNKGFIHTTVVDGYRYYKMAAEEWGESPKGESSFRGYLNHLKDLGLVNIVVSATGRKKRGVRARISMNDIPASVVIERANEQLLLIENL